MTRDKLIVLWTLNRQAKIFLSTNWKCTEKNKETDVKVLWHDSTQEICRAGALADRYLDGWFNQFLRNTDKEVHDLLKSHLLTL